MKGSLESPPILIVTSRVKAVLLLLVSTAFVAGGWLIIRDDPHSYGGYFCAGFFGLCALTFVWMIVSPPRLEISPRGISWFNGRTTEQYGWKDFADFRAYRPAPRTLSKHVGFEFAPDYPKRGKMTEVAHAMTGVEGSFGGSWEMSAQDLADLLNQAKAKWVR